MRPQTRWIINAPIAYPATWSPDVAPLYIWSDGPCSTPGPFNGYSVAHFIGQVSEQFDSRSKIIDKTLRPPNRLTLVIPAGVSGAG